MSIFIKEVVSPEEKKLFIKFSYQLNSKNPQWIPPLMISQEEILDDQHLFWRKNPHLFLLAYKNNQVVGRIAAFVDADHEAHFQRKDGFFGFLDAIDDIHIFASLLQRAEQFLHEQGCNSVSGPFNPSIHHELGVLVKGFELPPYFMLTYNASYYDDCLRQCGYDKLKDFFAYKLDTNAFRHSEGMRRVGMRLREKHAITIRTPKLKDFKNELRIFHEIYNNAFIGHWGFSPMSWDDFLFLGKDMKMVLDEEMVLIAEIKNEPVAFLLAIPNLNEVLTKIPDGRLLPFGIFKLLYYKRKVKSLRVITVAVKKEFTHLGLGSVLYPEIAQRSQRRGYQHSELSWVVEDNAAMNKISKVVGGEPYKQYRLYQKDIR